MTKLAGAKKKGKKILINFPLIKKLSEHYRRNVQIEVRNSIENQLIFKNNWIFTQPKTGTTYLCNMIAFYVSAVVGNEACDFSELEKFGVLREIGENFSGLSHLGFWAKNRIPIFVVTHGFRVSSPSVLILTSRNVLDQLCSMYFWRYNNGYSSQLTISQSLPMMIEEFKARYNSQKKAAKEAELVIGIAYESLIENPHAELRRVISSVCGSVDSQKLDEAVEKSSKRSVQEFERRLGYAIVAKRGKYKKKSFIRNGAVGEGEDLFSKTEKAFIAAEMQKDGIPLHGQSQMSLVTSSENDVS